MIKVAVTGAAGRMGSGIIRKIMEQDDMEVVAAFDIAYMAFIQDPNIQLPYPRFATQDKIEIIDIDHTDLKNKY